MRVEAGAAQYSQQIEQLKALSTNVLRQAVAKPADDQPRESATPRSARPQTDPLEGKLSAQHAKLVSDVFKLAEVGVKFDVPKDDFSEFLAQKQRELTELSDRLRADQARHASEFSSGVDRFKQQFVEDAGNIADTKATFEEDDGNIRDTRANYEADADEVESFRQNFVQDGQDLQAFRENFGEDNQSIREFNKDFSEDSANVQDAQANFVQDRNNVEEFQRDFVEDQKNSEQFQADFVEDKAEVAAFRENYAADAKELQAQRENYQEDVHEVSRFRDNFVDDKNTMFQFNEQYGSELEKISSFRSAYDREVDNIERHQKAADLQKAALNSTPPRQQASQPSNIPSDARAFASQDTSVDATPARSKLSLSEISSANKQSARSIASSNAPATRPPSDPPPAVAASPNRQASPLAAQRPVPTQRGLPAEKSGFVQPRTIQPAATSVSLDITPQASDAPPPSSTNRSQPNSLPTANPPVAAHAAPPAKQQDASEPDVFQLAGLLATQMATGAPAQASLNRSDIAAVNAGQAGDLKSGFSFLTLTAKKDDRRKRADDEEDDEQQ